MIISNNSPSLCKAECGSDWSQPIVQTTTKKHLKEKFGDNIILDYCGVDDCNIEFSEVDKFPLLVINGDIRLSGPFDMRQLFDIIETQIELGTPYK